ncbi:hypothetical protein E2C01_095261 [Portunus trituberculatus]|uniref:Secreted protein n=1 Tax=Portunus trituberculatus TaxID=210409 RepID=A0A5B7JSL3_PORTR|nr:hypothetical protein [Portunus trituberculatus]
MQGGRTVGHTAARTQATLVFSVVLATGGGSVVPPSPRLSPQQDLIASTAICQSATPLLVRACVRDYLIKM